MTDQFANTQTQEPQEIADVIVTRAVLGICHMQVCAHKTVPHDAVEREANRENPAGTEHGWRLLLDDAAENQRPVVCETHPDRLHYMLVC